MKLFIKWRTFSFFKIYSNVRMGLCLKFSRIGLDQMERKQMPKAHRLIYHFPVVWYEIFLT